MLALQALGSLELHGPGPRAKSALLSQPKRLALLLFLLLAYPRGFHRRDKLLALFWPELDTEHGRHALRQAVYVLRSLLGARVIASRGADEIGVAPAALRCDVLEFEDALRRGDPARAVALYRGDLMDGFYVKEVAPEFEYWLDGERERLRTEARKAAWTLAGVARDSGDRRAAAEWAAWAAALAPGEEEGQRRLILLLDELGDRAGAVSAYDTFARRLLTDYGLAPSPDLSALVKSLRAAEPTNGGSRPVANHSPHPDHERWQNGVTQTGPPGGDPPATAPAQSKVSSAPSPPVAAPARRPRALVGALALAGLVVVGGLAWRGRPWFAPPAKVRVLVLPFRAAADAESQRGAVLTEALLAAKIDASPAFSAVEAAGAALPPDEGAALAQRSGASGYISGSATASGRDMRLTGSLLLEAHGSVTRVSAAVTGRAEQLPSLVDALLGTLVRQGVPPARRRIPTSLEATTRVPAALHAYLDGEVLARAGDVRGSIAAFERALRADTAFALAAYRLSAAAAAAGEGELGARAARRALAHATRLGERKRLLLLGRLGFIEGSAERAEAAYSELLADNPQDLAALLGLADLQLRLNPLRGRRSSEADAIVDRALAVAPDDPDLLLRSSELALKAGRTAIARARLAHGLALAQSTRAGPYLRALEARLSGDPGLWTIVLRELAAAPDTTIANVAGVLATFAGDLQGAYDVSGIVASQGRSASARARARVALAELDLARGRWRAAERALEWAEAANLAWGAAHHALLAATTWLPLDAPTLSALRERTAENLQVVPADPALAGPAGAGEGVQGQIRAYVLGLLSVRLGDTRAALRYASELEDAPPPEEIAHEYAATLRALVEQRAGHRAAALRHLQRVSLTVPASYAAASALFSQPLARSLRGELLAERGAHAEALGWLAALGDASLHDLVYAVPAELRLSALAEKLGDPRAASEHAGRFLALWSESDPELRPLVLYARARLSRTDLAPAGGMLP